MTPKFAINDWVIYLNEIFVVRRVFPDDTGVRVNQDTCEFSHVYSIRSLNDRLHLFGIVERALESFLM